MFFLLAGNRFAALSFAPGSTFEVLHRIAPKHFKTGWDMPILKILDSHPNGQALTC
jgi:hypothetical protein